MADAEASVAPETAFVSSALAKVAVVSFFLLVLLLGAWVAGAGFHDPDTCWLLALGRIIFEKGALPTTDPFSYTFALPPEKPFVLYQWLTEVLLYGSYHIAGLLGVLFLVSLVVVTAFVIVPLATYDRIGTPRLQSMGLIALAIFASTFHLLIRPEVFSYLLISLLLCLMLQMRSYAIPVLRRGEVADLKRTTGIDWRFVIGTCLIMTLWCNLHTGFTSGLILLTVYVLAGLASSVGPFAFPLRTLVSTSIALVLSALCTLANPKGFALWTYLQPLFFARFNKYIIELQPLQGRDIFDLTWLPFYILAGLTIVACTLVVREEERAPKDLLFSFVVTMVLIGFGVSVRRLIPFSSLMLAGECAWLCSRLPRTKTTMWQTVGEQVRSLLKVNAAGVLTVVVISLVGTYMIASGPVKPHVPQTSAGFADPLEVLDYVRKNPPKGNGFNTPHFGDVMIWQLSPCPKVFIDTRFDMYGDTTVLDYHRIAYCESNWEDTFEKYKIDWLFLDRKLPLAKLFTNSDLWTVAAESKNAVFIVRKQPESAVEPIK